MLIYICKYVICNFGIFLDFGKVFEFVDHVIIIEKRDFYGIWGIAKDWFSSNLSNRQQFVSVNGIKADLISISCSMPQGSVLGPILNFIAAEPHT